MEDKIFTEKEILTQLKIKPEFFRRLINQNLIRAKGTAEGDMLVFSEETIGRVKEIQQFLSMGYSLEEVEKISKKIGLPSTKKVKEAGKKLRYLTVGELANHLNINARTIKYWEERGIIEPDTRSEGGFRLYSEHWIYLCELVKDLQLFGLSLEEIKEISDLFRDFLTIQGSLAAFPLQTTVSKFKTMREKIKQFYEKINEFKEGINRWEELLKRKEKEIRHLENKLKQANASKENKEKK